MKIILITGVASGLGKALTDFLTATNKFTVLTF
jgi:NADP-dependent 3-hydroxy acid dehydrogenase YdfG